MFYTCTSCEKSKEDTEFQKDNSKKNGKCAICKTCYKFNRFLNTSKNKFPDVFVGEFFAGIDKYYEKNIGEDYHTKRCTKCKEVKNLTEYVKCKSKYKGVKTQCISCEKERTLKNKEKEIDKNAVKICVKCKIEKNVEEFYKDSNCKLGVKPDCKICCDVVKLKYRKINKESIIEKNKAYRKKPEVKKRVKIRLINNIQARLTKICRNRYYNSLRKNTINKSDSIIELIGCKISELKIYLENKFLENMSWDNYGLYGWHIDHVIPISNFDLTDHEQLKKCFNYKNLQPLWAVDNLKKGNKII